MLVYRRVNDSIMTSVFLPNFWSFERSRDQSHFTEKHHHQPGKMNTFKEVVMMMMMMIFFAKQICKFHGINLPFPGDIFG